MFYDLGDKIVSRVTLIYFFVEMKIISTTLHLLGQHSTLD